MIPTVAGVNVHTEPETDTVDIVRAILTGIIILPFYHEDNITFFALRVHYTIISGIGTEVGWWRLRWVTLPASFVHISCKFLIFYILGG